MLNNKTDYNRISSNYDLRYKVHTMLGVNNTLQNIVKASKPEKILEVGCGTGQWLSELEYYDSMKVGVDSSFGMLRQVRKNGSKINLICADANTLPFCRGLFDMIYCVNALHHFKDKAGFIRGTANLLKPDGTLSIVGVSPINENDKWYVYDYFANVYDNDLLRFPSFDGVTKWMEDAGLRRITKYDAERVEKDMIGEEVFSDNFLHKDQSSQLANLSDNEYADGINKIKNAIHINPAQLFSTRLTFVCITGTKL